LTLLALLGINFLEFYKHYISKGQREYLNDSLTKELMRDFYAYLKGKVEVPRIRHGSRQTLETLINEEALLLAKYLRKERKTWIPRITVNDFALIKNLHAKVGWV
jgi:hypothetical protein